MMIMKITNKIINMNTKELEQAIKEGWKTAKEIYTEAGVDEKTWTRFKKTLTDIGVRQKINRSNRNGGPIFSPEVEKQFQAWLMKNQTSQGNSSQIVKQATNSAFTVGVSLQVIMQSGNMEAAKEICQLITEGTKAQHDLKLEQQHNHQLQLEVKQLHEDLYNKDSEIDYLKKLNDFNTTQIEYYTKKYHSWYDDYENY